MFSDLFTIFRYIYVFLGRTFFLFYEIRVTLSSLSLTLLLPRCAAWAHPVSPVAPGLRRFHLSGRYLGERGTNRTNESNESNESGQFSEILGDSRALSIGQNLKISGMSQNVDFIWHTKAVTLSHSVLHLKVILNCYCHLCLFVLFVLSSQELLRTCLSLQFFWWFFHSLFGSLAIAFVTVCFDMIWHDQRWLVIQCDPGHHWRRHCRVERQPPEPEPEPAPHNPHPVGIRNSLGSWDLFGSLWKRRDGHALRLYRMLHLVSLHSYIYIYIYHSFVCCGSPRHSKTLKCLRP